MLGASCARAQYGDGVPSGLWAIRESIGLILGFAFCCFWLAVPVVAALIALRRSPLTASIWRLPLVSGVEGWIRAWWLRLAAHRATERALRGRSANPRDSKARYTLGVLYMDQRRWERAIEELRASWEINPERLDTGYRLARCLLERRRPEEARAALEACLTLRTDHQDSQLLLGKLLLENREWQAAEALWSDYVKHHRGDVEGWAMLGLSRVGLGEREAAHEAFQTAIERCVSPAPVNRARYRAAARLARRELRR